MVDTPALAAAAQAALMAADAIGFDTESKPTFLKGEVFIGPHLVNSPPTTAPGSFPSPVTATTVSCKASSPRRKC